MTTDGVLENRAPVTAGEAEAMKRTQGQTHVVNNSMPLLPAEAGSEWKSLSWYQSSLSLVVRLVSSLRCLCFFLSLWGKHYPLESIFSS